MKDRNVKQVLCQLVGTIGRGSAKREGEGVSMMDVFCIHV
jgi:hypothetical protein